MRKHIPNILTCCNLLCGAMSVIASVYDGNFVAAYALIMLGALFDFFDGFSARLLKVSSPIGKELDSLADDITFGLAPATMLFVLLFPEVGTWAIVALLIAAFSALRLAKFNLDERQTTSFIGLATPANAIFWASIVTYLSQFSQLPLWLSVSLLLISVLSCYLLVSELPCFSLKFHDYSWSNNKVRYSFLVFALLGGVACVVLLLITGRHLFPFGAVLITVYVAINVMLSVRH